LTFETTQFMQCAREAPEWWLLDNAMHSTLRVARKTREARAYSAFWVVQVQHADDLNVLFFWDFVHCGQFLGSSKIIAKVLAGFVGKVRGY
jgi:hypothetical protein